MCFLPEGLAEDSADESPVVDFFELFVLELDGLPVVSAAAPLLVLAPRIALVGDVLALALGAAEAVADAVALGETLAAADALGEAVAAGDALIPTDALAFGEA